MSGGGASWAPRTPSSCRPPAPVCLPLAPARCLGGSRARPPAQPFWASREGVVRARFCRPCSPGSLTPDTGPSSSGRRGGGPPHRQSPHHQLSLLFPGLTSVLSGPCRGGRAVLGQPSLRACPEKPLHHGKSRVRCAEPAGPWQAVDPAPSTPTDTVPRPQASAPSKCLQCPSPTPAPGPQIWGGRETLRGDSPRPSSRARQPGASLGMMGLLSALPPCGPAPRASCLSPGRLLPGPGPPWWLPPRSPPRLNPLTKLCMSH